MRCLVVAVLASVCLSGAAHSAAAQAPPPPPPPPSAEEQTAFGHLQGGRFREATPILQAVAAREPNNGRAWFRLGVALQGEGKLAEAIPAFEKALAMRVNPGIASMNIVRLHARLGHTDEAFRRIEALFAAGGGSPRVLERDSAFVALRADRRWAPMLARADSVRYPCRHQPEYKQFDFWVGDWNVFVNGNRVGTNRIDHLDEGCVLMENWDANGSQVGISINYYDPALSKWRQVYVWDAGFVTEFTGSFENGAMTFFAAARGAGGQTGRQRMVFRQLAKDSVTQVTDQTFDDGKTWTNVWNSVYVRKQP